MSLKLGKSTIATMSGKVSIFAPGDNGSKKKVGTLKVTVEVLPRTQFLEVTQSSANDGEVAKRLVKNIEAADDQTEAVLYTPELMDEIFEIDWQFNPIFEFVMAANNEQLGKALKRKN